MVGISYRRHRFPPVIIQHAVWLYSTQPEVFLIGNRVRILQPFEFLELVGDAEADHLAKLVASLLSPLLLPFRDPAVLRDQVY